MSESEDKDFLAGKKGPLVWMARNRVAANLLMAFFIVGGLLTLPRVEREVFPEAQLDVVSIQVAFPGATPDNVEEGVILPIEEAVRGLQGVDEVRSTAREGLGSVTVELTEAAHPDQVLNDVESAVDGITSFPTRAEEPSITLPTSRNRLLSLILYGELDRTTLDQVGQELRAALLRSEVVSEVTFQGIPPPEISIEVPQENLRRYGLTLPEVARRVEAATIEFGAGRIDAPSGEIALRLTEDREWSEEFADLTVLGDATGMRVTLGEMARIKESFRDEQLQAFYNGQPAIRMQVFRRSGTPPGEASSEIQEVLEARKAQWSDRVQTVVWEDDSTIYEERVQLLIKNALLGLVLVLAVLGLFLKPQLAFWVTLGIPITFLGVFLILPAADVSINMISLFAFLLVLGIVVDDAIVVGEAAFQHQAEGQPPRRAAVDGAHEVAVPVTFAVLTTLIAFVPMLFLPGVMGEFFRVIPLIVIPILLISLTESFFILPAHLGHASDRAPRPHLLRKPVAWQARFSEGFERLVDHRYRPVIRSVIAWRYLVLVAALTILILIVGLFLGGRLQFKFFPEIEGEVVTAQLEMPPGTSIETTRSAAERMTESARSAIGGLNDDDILRGIFWQLGTEGRAETGPISGGRARQASNYAVVQLHLSPVAGRSVSSGEITDAWREDLGEIPGAVHVLFASGVGPSAGADLSFQLSHSETQSLEAAATRLAEELRQFGSVVEVDRGFSEGEEELQFRLKPAARALGITESNLAAQLRGAYFGSEALRQQRGTDELRIYVRLPEEERGSVESLENFIVRTDRGEIPLAQAAHIESGTAPTIIHRADGWRTLTVTGDLSQDAPVSPGAIVSRVRNEILPGIKKAYPGLRHEPAGDQEDQRESLAALGHGMLLALIGIYGLLATAFRSYLQPVLILLAIPFGFVGAAIGHLLLGYNLSMISMLGLIALAGVVVNDSLVLVDVINRRRREEGLPLDEAIEAGSLRRFRPVLLTSLTTFFGLAPMIFETSLQARFLIPMAISLGVGVLFVTVITLMLVPAGYHVLEDLRHLFRRSTEEKQSSATQTPAPPGPRREG